MRDVEKSVQCEFTWNAKDEVGYFPFVAAASGEAVHQVIVANPVGGAEDLVIDFTSQGAVLGVELLSAQVASRLVASEYSKNKKRTTGR